MDERSLLFLATTTVVFSALFGVSSAAEGQVHQGRSPLYVPEPPTRGETWIPGLHYNVLITPSRDPGSSGKVELLELSMYTSTAASPQFRALLKAWLTEHRETVTYVREPAVAAGMRHAQFQARIFSALEEMGRSDLHERLDQWVREPEHFKVYENIQAPDETSYLALTSAFVMANGLNAGRFESAYHSAASDKRVLRAMALSSSLHVDGTPTFVIDRRFSVSPHRLAYPRDCCVIEDYERLIQLIDYLTAAQLGGYQPNSSTASRTSNIPQQ